MIYKGNMTTKVIQTTQLVLLIKDLDPETCCSFRVTFGVLKLDKMHYNKGNMINQHKTKAQLLSAQHWVILLCEAS